MHSAEADAPSPRSCATSFLQFSRGGALEFFWHARSKPVGAPPRRGEGGSRVQLPKAAPELAEPPLDQTHMPAARQDCGSSTIDAFERGRLVEPPSCSDGQLLRRRRGCAPRPHDKAEAQATAWIIEATSSANLGSSSISATVS